jgi:hypothetical protein
MKNIWEVLHLIYVIWPSFKHLSNRSSSSSFFPSQRWQNNWFVVSTSNQLFCHLCEDKKKWTLIARAAWKMVKSQNYDQYLSNVFHLLDNVHYYQSWGHLSLKKPTSYPSIPWCTVIMFCSLVEGNWADMCRSHI